MSQARHFSSAASF